MMGSGPSVTAQRVAIQRAAHQLLDDPTVFNDPVALRMIGEKDASALRNDPHWFEGSALSSYLRAFVAARSRYSEDGLALGVKRGVSQYVILGAGLDTFAYRNPYPGRVLHVFEVDHPSTQDLKRARLEEMGIEVPADLTFASVDFGTQSLEERLRQGGYDPGKRTFFSWLGVTEYLATETVMETLHFIASSPRGSAVVFDYMVSPSILTTAQQSRFDALARWVASAGEPWQTFFTPELLVKNLRAMGFKYIEDKGPEEINTRYFVNRRDGLRVGSLSHLIKARI